MKIIKVTSLEDKKPIYINVNMIGHFYTVQETVSYGRMEKIEHTRVGVVTHNNGGFAIVESVDYILKFLTENS
jgi:hypothetical protein